jgi:hypothetical protein
LVNQARQEQVFQVVRFSIGKQEVDFWRQHYRSSMEVLEIVKEKSFQAGSRLPRFIGDSVIWAGRNKAAITTAARIMPRTYVCANSGKEDISSPLGGKPTGQRYRPVSPS